jgi:lysophospholipase L1-like esterase
MGVDLLRRMLFWGCLPVAVPQGMWLRRRFPRFPGAVGADCGAVGSGHLLRVLAMGDSIVAGVGAGVTEAALPARFAAELSIHLERRVHWRALGRIGADAAYVRKHQIAQLGTGDLDVVLLSVGLNDVTALRSRRAFRRDLVAILDALAQHSPECRVVLAGLPPLHMFPKLPQPLRFLFGQRARSFDLLLADIARSRSKVLHVPTPIDLDPAAFAADGYHPSAASHARWARNLAEACVRRWVQWREAPLERRAARLR